MRILLVFTQPNIHMPEGIALILQSPWLSLRGADPSQMPEWYQEGIGHATVFW